MLFVGKLGILLEYMRIFCPNRQGFTYVAIHVLIWINLVGYALFALLFVFLCNPREKIWRPTVPGTCLRSEPIEVVSGSWSVVTDFCIIALPVHSIWHLKMSVRKKIGISGIFAIGLM